MALLNLLDEHFRGDIGRAILHHDARSFDPIDVVLTAFEDQATESTAGRLPSSCAHAGSPP
jgi:hypothetical protein